MPVTELSTKKNTLVLCHDCRAVVKISFDKRCFVCHERRVQLDRELEELDAGYKAQLRKHKGI